MFSLLVQIANFLNTEIVLYYFCYCSLHLSSIAQFTLSSTWLILFCPWTQYYFFPDFYYCPTRMWHLQAGTFSVLFISTFPPPRIGSGMCQALNAYSLWERTNALIRCSKMPGYLFLLLVIGGWFSRYSTLMPFLSSPSFLLLIEWPGKRSQIMAFGFAAIVNSF